MVLNVQLLGKRFPTFASVASRWCGKDGIRGFLPQMIGPQLTLVRVVSWCGCRRLNLMFLLVASLFEEQVMVGA
jgi:hypothetical protein